MVNKLMIHYGELYTKGGNRKDFIRVLRDNIVHRLRPFKLQINTRHDHIYISNFTEANLNEIVRILQNISGIHAISEVIIFDRDLEIVKDYVLSVILENKIATFKVITKRKDKLFPMLSDAINRDVAKHILINSEAKVDIHNPDYPVKIEIDLNAIIVLGKRYPGMGGYPLGSAGKSLVLLSGGIDSPVAAYSMIRRGIKVAGIHFAAPPYTSEEVVQKVVKLAKKLNTYQPRITLYIVPFTELQLAIYENVDHSYAITIMRRMMLRIAQVVAKRHSLKVLVTGDSLGQVASQTLESLVVINEVTNYPIIRPLATVDKTSIISLARDIDTLDISLIPYEDCCTIFEVKNPVTSPDINKVHEYESRFDWSSLISKAIGEIEKIIVE